MPSVSTFIILTMGAIMGALMIRRMRHTSRLQYIESYRFHPGVIKRFRTQHPQLDDREVKEVIGGLKDYFCLHHIAKKEFMAMPSQVVDDLWHEFILFTKQYQQFSNKALGRYLHHLPTEAMDEKLDASAALKLTWHHSCKFEKIDPMQPSHLPRLFDLDKRYKIPNGFYYTKNCHGDKSMGYCGSHMGCTSGCISGSDASSGGFSADGGAGCSSCSSCGGGD